MSGYSYQTVLRSGLFYVRRSDGLEFPPDPGEEAYPGLVAWLAAGGDLAPVPEEALEDVQSRLLSEVESERAAGRTSFAERGVFGGDLHAWLRFREARAADLEVSPAAEDYPLLAAEVPQHGADVAEVADVVLAELAQLEEGLAGVDATADAYVSDLQGSSSVPGALDAVAHLALPRPGVKTPRRAGAHASPFEPVLVRPLVLAVGLAYALATALAGGQDATTILSPGLAGATFYPFPVAAGDGWTPRAPSVDSRVVYVSSSEGDDSNDGLSEGAPKATPAAGYALMRDGYPDWLCFKCGDEWDVPLKTLWGLSGRSATERMVVTSYGTGARPKFRNGGSPVLQANTSVLGVFPQHLYFGDFEAHAQPGSSTPEQGIGWFGHSSDVIFENVLSHGYTTGLQITDSAHAGRHAAIQVRRCVLRDNYWVGSDARGLLVGDVDVLLVEGCYMLGNGYATASQYSQFRHNVYINNYCTAVTYRDNVSTGADGAMVRSGTVVTGNVCSQWNFGISVGPGYDVEPYGISPIVEDNVLLQGRDDVSGGVTYHAGGIALQVGNWVAGSLRRNVVANCTGTDPRVIWAHESTTGSGAGTPTGIVLRNVQIEDNLAYDAGGVFLHLQAGSGSSPYSNVLLSSNEVSNPGNLTSYDDAVVVSDQDLSPAQVAYAANHLAQRAGGFAPHFARLAGTYYSFSAWQSHVGDSGSDAIAQSYPSPAEATLGHYNQATYGDGTGDAGHAALVARMAAQERATWDFDLEARAIRAYVSSCFGL